MPGNYNDNGLSGKSVEWNGGIVEWNSGMEYWNDL
jgi:hypothetical protein